MKEILFTGFSVLLIVSGTFAITSRKFGQGYLHCKVTPTGPCSVTKDFKPGISAVRYCGATLEACINNTTQRILVNQVSIIF